MRPDIPIRTERDLTGGPIYWGAVAATLAGLVGCFLFPGRRAWLGCGVLLIWTAFSLANGIRSHRVHSTVSAPFYLAAALVLAGVAAARIDVQIWMVWLLGGGMIAANLLERVFGKYF